MCLGSSVTMGYSVCLHKEVKALRVQCVLCVSTRVCVTCVCVHVCTRAVSQGSQAPLSSGKNWVREVGLGEERWMLPGREEPHVRGGGVCEGDPAQRRGRSGKGAKCMSRGMWGCPRSRPSLVQKRGFLRSCAVAFVSLLPSGASRVLPYSLRLGPSGPLPLLLPFLSFFYIYVWVTVSEVAAPN